MTTKRAVPNVTVNRRVAFGTLAGLVATAMLLLGLSGTAAAAKPIGADGKIHTCYKAKGKAKGSLRVVRAGKKCKRGWKKLAWVATSTAGSPGATGAGGAGGTGGGGHGGSSGDSGANGTDKTSLLETQVASLSLKVDGLEGLLEGLGKGDLKGLTGTLDGISNGDLTGVIATLDGVTNGELSGVIDTLDGVTKTELTEALGLAPVLQSVCAQVSGLTGGLDAVNEGTKGLVTLVGTLLPIGTLPALPTGLLDSYTCPPV